MLRNNLKDLENYSAFKIIEEITKFTNKWKFSDSSGCPWYRGQDQEIGPNPSVFRHKYDEFNLCTTFRNRATAVKEVPETDRIDKWLFLMQHYGAPSRLLDWTESPLLAIFFALDSYTELCECKKGNQNPTVWAIHPFELNEASRIRGFPNTWSRRDVPNGSGKPVNMNPGVEYFRLAFHPRSEWNEMINLSIVKLPIAVHSNYLDMRILAQRSCFTIHGTEEKDFESLFEGTSLASNNFLLKFVIPGNNCDSLLKELNSLGINKSSVFPDLEHLAKEMKNRFRAIC